ncbi:MAG: hypothetical protein EDS66_05645 [Planctomycetota bacterium]|nr:MAG: hypothetical protein EDS66_05645 [Planctomycetota bacterium]MCQ3921323.1 hypothetical protein [Planctomycetota bacterium]
MNTSRGEPAARTGQRQADDGRVAGLPAVFLYAALQDHGLNPSFSIPRGATKRAFARAEARGSDGAPHS